MPTVTKPYSNGKRPPPPGRDAATPDMFENDLLTTAEAAKLLRLSVSTLERKRTQGTSGLPFVKLGIGKQCKIAYRRADLDQFLRANLYTSTSEYGRAK